MLVVRSRSCFAALALILPWPPLVVAAFQKASMVPVISLALVSSPQVLLVLLEWSQARHEEVVIPNAPEA